MYDVSKIIEKALTLVKFRDEGLTDFTTLVPEAMQGTGSFYVNDLPGLTLFDVVSSLEYDTKGQMQSTLNKTLTKAVENGVITVIEEFLSQARKSFRSGDIIRDLKVVNKPAPFGVTEQGDGRFIGYRIQPRSSKGLKVVIPKLGFQLQQAQSLNVYLYASTKKKAVKIWTIEIDSDLELVWADIEEEIVSYSAENEGCQFFLGFYEASPEHVRATDLQTNPMKGEFTGCCGNDDAIIKVLKYSKISPVVIPFQDLNWSDTEADYLLPGRWDLEGSNNLMNYDRGKYWLTMQFKLNVSCDLTEILLTNIEKFLRAFQYQIAIELLWDCYRSGNRSAEHEKKLNNFRNFALKYENALKGDNESPGILSDLVLDLSGVDKACLHKDFTEMFIGTLNNRR